MMCFSPALVYLIFNYISLQLIPHLVMDIFTNNPGLSGLFLAAVYSGSLRFVQKGQIQIPGMEGVS